MSVNVTSCKMVLIKGIYCNPQSVVILHFISFLDINLINRNKRKDCQRANTVDRAYTVLSSNKKPLN